MVLVVKFNEELISEVTRMLRRPFLFKNEDFRIESFKFTVQLHLSGLGKVPVIKFSEELISGISGTFRSLLPCQKLI